MEHSKNNRVKKLLMKRIDVRDFLDYRLYLEACYVLLKKELKPYSYVSFTQNLGFSKSNHLYLVIKGTRALTLKSAHTIAKSIEMEKEQKKYFLNLVRYQNTNDMEQREKLLDQLTSGLERNEIHEIERKNYAYFEEWYTPVIREMIGMQGFEADPIWISQNLSPKIRPEQARKSLELLQELGYIRYDFALKKFVQVDKSISTTPMVKHMAAAKYHFQSLDLAKRQVTSYKEPERDLSSTIVCLDQERIRRVKKLIKKLTDEILREDEECEVGDRIYQVNIQLFPTSVNPRIKRKDSKIRSENVGT